MLDTIIVAILILSALAYGFWQYFARPNEARDKRKSEFVYFWYPRGDHQLNQFHAVILTRFRDKKCDSWKDRRSLKPTHRHAFYSFSILRGEERIKEKTKKFRLPLVISVTHLCTMSKDEILKKILKNYWKRIILILETWNCLKNSWKFKIVWKLEKFLEI